MLPRGPEPDHELFRYLSDADIEKFRGRVPRMEVDTGDIIVEQDETSTRLFVIEDGLADVISVGRYRELLVNRLGPGQIFGEVALIDGSPRTARVRASTPMKLLVIDREEFVGIAEQDPSLFARISLAVLESLCRKFRASLTGPH
jgi:CRP-like cAMP-binding protein